MNLKITFLLLFTLLASYGVSQNTSLEPIMASAVIGNEVSVINADEAHFSSSCDGQLLIRLTKNGDVVFSRFFKPEVLTTENGYLFRKGNSQIVLPATVGGHEIYHLCTALN